MDDVNIHLTLNPAYLAFGVAIFVGSLITVPWRAGGAPSSLLIVPLISAYWRFGLLAAPLLIIAVAVANMTRRAAPLSTLAAALLDVVAFALACLVASAVGAVAGQA